MILDCRLPLRRLSAVILAALLLCSVPQNLHAQSAVLPADVVQQTNARLAATVGSGAALRWKPVRCCSIATNS